MTDNEAKLTQALSTAVWWLRELAKSLPRGTREQAIVAAGDGRKVIDAMLDGKPLPEWLSPITGNPCAGGHDFSYAVYPAGKCRRCGAHD